jgi:uncharacterized protein YraI
LVFFEGTLTIKVNVRGGPGTTYDSLGQLNQGEKVQVLHKDKSGGWYEIVYAAVTEGRGWVAAQYVQLPAGTEIPLDATPTPSGPIGEVIQRLNVRSGPATSYDSLGVLEAHATVSLTGKNSTASWFQIAYTAGPGGKGWVTAQYVQTQAAAELPVLDEFGTPAAVATANGGPSSPVFTPTPTLGPAFTDGDSRTSPSVQVVFSAIGTHRIDWTSQVSAPEGDPEDWVEFTPFASSGTQANIVLSLVCQGNGSLQVELWQGESLVNGWGSLTCNGKDTNVGLAAGYAYVLRLAPMEGEGLRLINYTLTVVNEP